MRTNRYIVVAMTLLGALGFQCSATAQSGYQISLTLSGNQNGKVEMALQTTDKMIIIDSLPNVIDGTYHFTGNQPLTPGQYAFLQNGRRLFHFLISFEEMVNLQFSALVENGQTSQLSVLNDPENEAYIKLQRFIQDVNRKSNPSEADFLSVDRYTDSISLLFPNSILSIIARNISTPPLPQYMALHDKRVLNTSLLPLRLQSFFTNVVSPQPDKIIPQIDSILNYSTDPLVKDWCGTFLLSYFLSSNIMGMEKVAIHIAKKYIDGEIKNNDQDFLHDLEAFVSFNENSLIGLPAPELLLPDADGQLISLRNLDANYTILLFYDENCPICLEELPEIDQVVQQYKSHNIKVYAVYTQDRYEAWRTYVLTLNPEWTFVWDPQFSSGFHKLYNVTGTPTVYLLDKDKIIIGREMDALVLQEMLSYYLN